MPRFDIRIFILLTTPASGAEQAFNANGMPISSTESEFQTFFARAEAVAYKSQSPQAADQASEAAINCGRVDRGASWVLETLGRKVHHATGGRADAVAAVRSYGLLALALHLEAFATQLTRELLRGVQDGTAASHVQSLMSVCGSDTDASRALQIATARAELTLTLPRSVTAGLVAQCAVEQQAAAMLVKAGATGTKRHVADYTLMHLLAQFGDAKLVRSVAAALPAEVVTALLRTEGTPARVTPAAVAAARGHDECAAALEALASSPPPVTASLSRLFGGLTSLFGRPEAGASITAKSSSTVQEHLVPAEASATTETTFELGENGGWGSVTSESFAFQSARCDFAVESAALDADEFARKYIVPERPVLIRNGTAAQWASLRKLLAKQTLTDAFGSLQVKVGSAPYYEASVARSTTLREYAETVVACGNEPTAVPIGDTKGDENEVSIEYLFLGLYPRSNPLHGSLEEQLEPPLVATQSLERRHLYYRASTQLSVGPAGSGSPPHYHMAAVNTLVYGLKRWWLMPPRDAVYGALPVREWHAAGGPTALRAEGRTVLECVQRPGDVIFVPDHWGHAVLNLETSIGFASEFATARGHSMRFVM